MEHSKKLNSSTDADIGLIGMAKEKSMEATLLTQPMTLLLPQENTD
jgi:hypothetical protein